MLTTNQTTLVSDVMTKNVITAKENTTIEEVFEKLKDNHIHHIPIVNEQEEIVGLISYQDVVKLFHPSTTYNHPQGWLKTKGFLQSLLAKEIMTKNIYSLNPDSQLSDAIELLLENQFHCIPIISNKKILGMLTPFDIIKRFKEG